MASSDTSLNDYFQNLLSQIESLNLSDDQLNSIMQALPLLALQQQGEQTQYSQDYLKYQNDYLSYLNDQTDLNREQLAQAQEELRFKEGPYWDWYIKEYFPAQEKMSQNDLSISNNNRLQSQESTKQAQLATQAAYLNMFAKFPGARTNATSDGRRVPGMLSYTLGYPT